MTTENAGSSHFESHITIDAAGDTVINQLKQNTALNIQTLKKAMKNGSVWLESSHGIHRIRRAKKNVNKGDQIHLYYDEAIQNTQPEAAILIADEGDYSIWNKPYGMYSQGTKWGDQCSIYRWAEQHLKPQRTAFVVHRLDRAANGLIILAHSKKMAAVFSGMFKYRKIKKQYKAVIAGNIQQLTLPYTISSDIDDKPAVTHIKEQTHNGDRNNGKTSTLTIEIETGRKHQIRKHLAEISHPILGDRLYGKEPYHGNLQLCAYLLEFHCPLTDELKTYVLKDTVFKKPAPENTALENMPPENAS